MTHPQYSSGTEYVPADLAARIELYLDDSPMYGDHSDKAGGSCWELLREAMDELRAPSPSLEVLIQRWMADARQLDEAAKQEDIGDDEAALNKYCAEQLRRCIRDVEGIHGAAQAVPDALRAAAERVCWFDWSDNDMDAVAAIDALRKALMVPSTSRATTDRNLAESRCEDCPAPRCIVCPVTSTDRDTKA